MTHLSSVSMRFLLTVQLLYSQSAGGEIIFARGDYAADLMKQADAKKIVSVVRENYDTTRYDVAPDIIEDYPWYTLVDFTKEPRFSDIGLLFICTPELAQGHHCGPCTAFYVGDDLLASAGHCIVNSGSRHPANVLCVFFPRLDGMTLAALSDDEIVQRAKIVKSWWIPEDFYKDPSKKCGKQTDGHDIAFLRVNTPKQDHRQKKFYNLTPPGDFVSRKIKVIEVGYPADVPNVLRPVKVETTLHAPEDEDVKRVVPAISPDALKTTKGCQVVLVARNRGISFGGASGAPLFPALAKSEGTLDVPPNNVIGIHSWSKRSTIKQLSPASVVKEAFVSPLISQEIVAVQNWLRQGKGGEKKVKSVEAGAVQPVVCGRTNT